MLKINIFGNDCELWDERTQTFIYPEDRVLCLEHSLISISKWESKYHKPFLAKSKKTDEETMYYIKCMVLDDDFDIEQDLYLNAETIYRINQYINDPMTATWFNQKDGKDGKDKKNKKAPSSEQITSELIYYWMVALNIPFECERWHINRLLTLIEVCNVKNEKPKKMSKKELYSRNSSLNELRRRQMNTHG